MHGINTEESLDAVEDEELYITAWEMFPKFIKTALRYKCFVLWSELGFVSVHILDSDEECARWIADANRLFEENPIPDSDDPKSDDFNRKCRFVSAITFEQFTKIAGKEFENPDNFLISETGLEFAFEDCIPVYEARANGEI